MNAPLQARNPARLSLVHFLTLTALPDDASCDVDQIDALGELAAERREHALNILAKGFQSHFTAAMRRRLINVMREMRDAGRHGGARFLLELFAKLEIGTGLVAREQALQAGAQGEVLRALELWSDALLVHKDPLALSNVAYHLPALCALNTDALQPRLGAFVDNVTLTAPLIANSDANWQDLEPRLEAMTKALAAHGFSREARTLGKIAIDLKLKWGFAF